MGAVKPMTDWRTFPTPGVPRDAGYLERLARHRGAKLGYRVHRSRRRKGRDNAGEFMLIHKASSTVLLGAAFTATLEAILEFMEREQRGHESAIRDLHGDAAHPRRPRA
jgi:hypothetical protein